jgi:hypothetical protein
MRDSLRWLLSLSLIIAAVVYRPGETKTALAETGTREKDRKPLTLHPDNAHYFLFRGKPTVLITSAEHYGAVLNLDFDYVRYLDTLQANGLNHTRTFAGTYREIPGSFGITDNTLAPLPNRYVSGFAGVFRGHCLEDQGSVRVMLVCPSTEEGK